MGSHPRPHFFISRPDHTITPLIAVDELPDHIRINGVPALMSQADTQAMMSLGVKERSIGYYDVHLVKSLSSSSRSAEGPAKYTSPSGTDSSSKESDDVNHLKSPDKQKEHIEKTTAGSSSAQVIHHPDLIDEAEKTASLSKATHGEVGDQTSVDVEEWRQKIDNDETQAKIDALVAASTENTEEVKEKLSDENSRAERAKVGITPGKKVYCSHWIRTGECDFTQQGCLYKHDMPDENTLKAIGIRTLPAWYVAAHPQKARERGFGKVNASGSRLWGARRNHFPATTFTPSQMPFRRQPPVFDQSPAVGFPGKLSATFFAAPAGFSSNFTPPPIGSHFDQHPVLNRVQELPDQSYPQYHSSARGHGKELQIMRKPPKPKTPGYNTFAFQLPPLPSSPDSATAPAVEKPQTKHAPVWGPRPSKLAKGFAHRTQNPKSTRNEDDAAAQGLVPAASNLSQDINNLHVSAPSASNGQITKSTAEPNSSHYPSLSQSAVHCATLDAPSNSRSPAINSSFPSLIPSPPPEAKAVTQPSHDRKASICSDLFALAPKTPSPPHRRLFVSPGGERYVTAAEEPQAVSRESPELKKGVASSRYQERPQKSSHKGRQPARTKADCLKNLLDCDRKQRGVSPEKAPRKKRAVKEHAQKNELLVEIE